MIRLTAVTKSFEDNAVLKGIDLQVPAQSRCVLIGTAASGKSVLMKCLIGLYHIDGGRIEIAGRDIATLQGVERRHFFDDFGMLFQLGGLFDSLTAWENIAFKQVNRRTLDPAEARDLAIEILKTVDMGPDVADLYPVSLSGGMQKRVGLARAVAAKPKILLLDEPTAGLDPITTQVINRMVVKVAGDLGATLLSVTSDMEAARRHYDQIAMLHEGRIVWNGTPAQADESDNPYLRQLLSGRGDGPIQMRVRSRVA